MPAGLTLVLTSPRVVDGVLSWAAWSALHDADLVLARIVESPGQVAALAEAGVTVQAPAGEDPRSLARELVGAAAGSAVAWLGSPDGDPGLTDALADELSRVATASEPPPVEVVVGSHDGPGARLLDLVAVMDRLRSPGGCPWDAEQTHASLTPYLLEEAHEAVEAIEAGDRAGIREELGDVLLQVAFHARVAQEDEQDPFDIDDVAAGIVAKLVRRHPHVFGDTQAPTAAHVEANWEQIKAAEKGRESALDGIPLALPRAGPRRRGAAPGGAPRPPTGPAAGRAGGCRGRPVR